VADHLHLGDHRPGVLLESSQVSGQRRRRGTWMGVERGRVLLDLVYERGQSVGVSGECAQRLTLERRELGLDVPNIRR